MPPEVAAWFASPGEVVQQPYEGGIAATIDSVEIAIERALMHIGESSPVSHLTIGVDPGPRPGIGWIGDGLVLGRVQLEGVDDTVIHIERLRTAIEHEGLTVRVGDGSTTIANRIINLCLARGYPVERVDERRTSHGVSRHQHSSAAIRIARIEGEEVRRRQRVSPTEGEVREIQRRSRRASGGRTTIPGDLARAVAVGRLSMVEAIRSHTPSKFD